MCMELGAEHCGVQMITRASAHLFTARSRALPDKLPVVQLLKSVPNSMEPDRSYRVHRSSPLVAIL
jgi:hypothetical protein